MSVLIGATPVRTVRELTQTWETGQRIGLVALEGPTGIGKTAIVQALYAQLAMRQSRPAYWPPALDAGLVRRQARVKQNFPARMSPAPGAKMEYFWWGWTARPQEFAVRSAEFQIKQHVMAIADSIKQGDRLTRDRLALALTTLTLLASHGLLGPLLDAVLPAADDLRTVQDLARKLPNVLHTKAGLLDKARKRTSGTTFSVTARPEALSAAESEARWLGLTANLLPVLIVVEDAQFLDRVSISLLQHLSRQPGGRGLIVLTADTDQPGEALGTWLKADDRIERLRIPPLSPGELTEIAVAELGTALNGPNLARVVAHSAGVPGTLYDLIEAPAVATALRDASMLPDLQTIDAEQAVRSALASASPPVRQALAAASIHGRLVLRDWLAADADADAAVDSGWLLPRQGTGVIEFASPRLLDVTRAVRARELTEAAQDAVRVHLLEHVERAHTDQSWADLAPDIQESLLACALEPDLATASPPLVAELFDLRRSTGRAATDAGVLDTITARLATSQPSLRVLVVATAEALFDAGRIQDALSLLHDDLDRARHRYGQDDPRTRPALHNLAAAYAAAAHAVRGHPEAGPRYEEALTRYAQLLAARVSTKPPDLLPVIRTRTEYAELLAECYRFRDAITQGETLLAEQDATIGPEAVGTLHTRAQLAYWRAESGDAAGAAAAFGQLIPDQTRVFGPYHVITLVARLNRAVYAGQAGDIAAELAELELLLADQRLALGHKHPLTMSTRYHLAYARALAGDYADAIASYEDVLTDRMEVLGPEDRETLATLAELASCRGRAGDPAAAVAGYQEIFAARSRVLGPDDIDTLTARSNLVYWHEQAREYHEAIAAAAELLADRTRVLGPDHPDTLLTRNNLAYLRGEAGDPAAAVAALTPLVNDTLRVLGPAHPTTRMAISNYQRWSRPPDQPGPP
jgi:tetratricopeptide (TPR) repeat protein